MIVRLLLAASLALGAHPLTGGQPPSGRQMASIAGIVTDTGTGRPIALATISLRQSGAPGRLTLTDAEGRFEFTEVPAGAVSLSASKAGYVSASFGSRKPGKTPTISLDNSQRLNAPIGLSPSSAIGGTVTDASGGPLQASLRMSRRSEDNGDIWEDASFSGSYQTDDRGAFRIFGLPAGQYRLSVIVDAPRPLRVTTEEEVKWALRRLSGSTGDIGNEPPPSKQVPLSTVVVGVPVYYPGTVDSADAVAIVLGNGESLEITFRCPRPQK